MLNTKSKIITLVFKISIADSDLKPYLWVYKLADIDFKQVHVVALQQEDLWLSA